MPVSEILIGRHERNFFRDGFFHEVFQRVESSLFDHLTDNISLAGDGSDHHRLAAEMRPPHLDQARRGAAIVRAQISDRSRDIR